LQWPPATVAIDVIWSENGSGVIRLPKGTSLWHAGLVGPQQPLNDERGLWLTNESSLRHNYSECAGQYARQIGAAAFLREFQTVRELRLADFGKASMGNFTEKFCNAEHDLMKRAVLAWIRRRGFDGIVSINGGADEVVISRPVADLEQIAEEQLWPTPM
jgi:hypothetical protein